MVFSSFICSVVLALVCIKDVRGHFALGSGTFYQSEQRMKSFFVIILYEKFGIVMTHCVLLPAGQTIYHIKRMARFLFIILFCMLSISSHAAYQAFTRLSKQPGIWGLLSHEDRIDAYFFQASTHALMVLDEGDGVPRYGSLEAAMKKNACEAGINGGYFSADKQRTPLGLLKHRGTCKHHLSKGAFTVAGVLYDTGRDIKLERSSRLSLSTTQMKEAIQGGPFLVDKGSAVAGLDAKKHARRTFVATDGRGTWCIAITSPLTLRQLATWLAKPGTMGKFKVETALNLDGGTSTAIWINTPRIYKVPFKDVRNYVGISRRNAAHPSR